MSTNDPAPAGGAGAVARMPLPKFTFGNVKGEDWVSFKRRYDYYRAYYGAIDKDAAYALRGCMVGAAGAAVHNVKIEGKTYVEVVEAYDALFLPPAASALAQTKFEQVVQGKGEDVMNYHARVLDLWQRAYPTMKDESILIRKFAMGLSQVNVRSRVLRGPTDTYSAALTLAQSEVAVENTNRALVGNLSSNPPPVPMEIGHIGSDDEEEEEEDQDETLGVVRPGGRGRGQKKVQRRWNPNRGPPGRNRGEASGAGSKPPQRRQCYECGSNTHLVADCRVRRNKRRSLGQRVMAAVAQEAMDDSEEEESPESSDQLEDDNQQECCLQEHCTCDVRRF